jgi:predicted PurR-regulated permease PerM
MNERLAGWAFTYCALVLLSAVALIFSMRSVLSPVVLFPLFILLMWPFAGDRRHRLAIVAASIVFLIWMLDTLGSLLAPFLLAAALAYILDPAVDMLGRRRVPRSLAILLLGLPALALVVLTAVLGVPALITQIDQLLDGVPAALERVGVWLTNLETRLSRLDLPLIEEQRIIAQIQAALDPQRIVALLQRRQGEIMRSAWAAALGIGRGFGVIAAILGYLVLTPVLLFYLLRDWDRITAAAASLFPESTRAGWIGFAREYDRLLSRFLRGQLLAAAIVGVLTWLGLLILDFPYSGLVGAIAGVFNIVPYLGLIVSVLPVVIIAIVSGNVLVLLLKAGIVFAVVQFIDSSVTGPRIVGESVGLHPVWVMLALAVSGFAFGFAGLLLAMPAAVLIKLLLHEALTRWRASSVFRGAASADIT